MEAQSEVKGEFRAEERASGARRPPAVDKAKEEVKEEEEESERGCKGRRYRQTERTHELGARKKWTAKGCWGGDRGGWQNSALCAVSETPVFMTLLGHNDAHCIVPHVKHTPLGDLA